MPIVAPFRGLRYDPKHVGGLSEVIAPPYDVIDAALQNRLYEQHPANVIRLELNREEPGDDDTTNKYSRAARFFRAWREQGVIMQEGAAALYVYHQSFSVEGQHHVRRGVMARVRLERFGTGSIHPHEETMSGPKLDRLLLTRACRANLSQVFGLYPDPDGAVQALLDAAVAGQPPLEAIDHLGVGSRLWPLTDEAVATRVAGLMGGRPVFIADGHHRYETACNYRDEVAAAWAESHGGAPLPSDHPANFVLMMLVGMSDPGLVVLPTHRLFVQPSVPDAATLARKLGECFTTEPAGKGPEAAEAVWSGIEAEGDQGTLGLYTAGDRAWTTARITAAGRSRMAAALPTCHAGDRVVVRSAGRAPAGSPDRAVVDADLGHDIDHRGVERSCRRAPGRSHHDPVAGVVGQQGRGHLRPPGVVDAHEQHLGPGLSHRRAPPRRRDRGTGSTRRPAPPR